MFLFRGLVRLFGGFPFEKKYAQHMLREWLDELLPPVLVMVSNLVSLEGRVDLPRLAERCLSSSPNRSSLPTPRDLLVRIEIVVVLVAVKVMGFVVNFRSPCSIVVGVVEIVEVARGVRGGNTNWLGKLYRGWLPDEFDEDDVLGFDIPRRFKKLVLSFEKPDIFFDDESI
nr:hypothetical protein [Tanacetum cinerariifolium]